MQKIITTLVLLAAAFGLSAQTTATFENFGLPEGHFLNGSDGGGGFASGSIFLPNDYNPDFGSWGGWSISATTDTETPGFMNQYSSITGNGYGGSGTFAVTYCPGGCAIYLEGAAAGGLVEGMYITNSTYAYLSMLNGDAFAKKFGGETGDDPDFLLLTVKKYLDGEVSADSVNFYLADYRFSDNAQDYIINEWTYLGLSSLGNADSLVFELRSTDVGAFGMNTPAYFCIDHVATADVMVSAGEQPADRQACRAYPNPSSGVLTLEWPESRPGQIIVFDALGRKVQQMVVYPGQNHIDISSWAEGAYFFQMASGKGSRPLVVVKK